MIDTPGIFNADCTEEEVQSEIYSCYTQSAPGPHAFLFVLLIEKFTEQEQATVDQMQLHFGENVFLNTTVVFTHGDQLQEGTEIMDFVEQSKGLKELIQKCEGRCHVIDNKYWKNSQDPYRNNSFQVQQILNSVEITVGKNSGIAFTNEKFQQVEREIQKEQNRIHNTQGLSEEESREQAKSIVLQNYIAKRKLWRWMKNAGFFIATLSVAFVFVPKFVSYLRGRAVSESAPGVNEVSSVMEVVQQVVAPIKSTLDYIIEATEAILNRKRPAPPNKTLTEF